MEHFDELDFPKLPTLEEYHLTKLPDLELSDEALLDDARVSEIVLRVILIWAKIEKLQQVIALRLLGENASEYLDGKKPSAQDKVDRFLDHIVKHYANGDWRDAFKIAKKAAYEVKAYRHYYTHFSWGRSPALPEKFLLVKPKALSEARVRQDRFIAAFNANPSLLRPEIAMHAIHQAYPAVENIWVWDESDFERVLNLSHAANYTYQALLDCLRPTAAYIGAGHATEKQVLDAIKQYRLLSVPAHFHFTQLFLNELSQTE